MRVVRSRAELAEARAGFAEPIGFVPTMGALHEGHASLVRQARADNATVAASIFVNPTQFGPNEDFTKYPRDEQADLAMLEELGVDLVFLPSVEEIYPSGASTSVDVGKLGERLEGKVRPGHFRGVATVVTILFDLVQPTRSYFGQKDGQQAVVIKRFTRDLGVPVEIVVCPTVRESDGLAMSSRNRYLAADEREQASALHKALKQAADDLADGETDADRLRLLMAAELTAAPLGVPDYVSIADNETLEELETVDRPALASLAVRFPSARLIDCLPIGPADLSASETPS
jgi:pantoate--beta-alanine ligase